MDTTTVGVIVVEGVDPFATTGLASALRAAPAADCPVETTLYSLVPSDTVAASGGVAIAPDDVLIGTPDVVVVPGGDPFVDAADGSLPRDLAERVGQLAEAGATVASVGTGAAVLAAAGRLEGRRVAVPDALSDTVSDAGATPVEERLVAGEDVITAAAPADAPLLAAHLLGAAGCAEEADVVTAGLGVATSPSATAPQS